MHKRRRIVLLSLAIALTAALWFRPVHWVFQRGEPDYRDFAPVIAGAHCLFHTCNPYDWAEVERIFQRLSGHQVFMKPGSPVYPPSTFLAVSPLLPMKWPAIRLAWTMLSAASLLGIYVFLILKFDLYASAIAYAPILFVLQSGIPFSALWVGQPVLISVCSGLLGLVLMVSGALPVLAVLSAGISLALKPQLVFAPALYLLFGGRTRKLAAASFALSAFIFIASTALLAHRLGGMGFFHRESENIRFSFQPGQTSDPSPANPDSAGFLNLQPALLRLDPNMPLANDVAYGLCIALFCALAYGSLRGAAFREQPYSIIAALTLLCLIPVYHRGYDRLTLLFLIPALWELRSRSKGFSWALTALSCLWIFGNRLAGDLHPAAANFPYAPFIEAGMCAVLIAALLLYEPPPLYEPPDDRRIVKAALRPDAA